MPDFETPDETLPVDWVPREELLPNEWNPSSMGEEKREELVFSILDNGWTQPLVVKKGSDTIVDGEQRWHAAGDARIRDNDDLTPEGVPAGHVPVFELGVDETQARVATMQHNVNGDTDSDALGDVLADLDDEGLFYDVSERLTIGETGIDRLIDRARSDTEPSEDWYDEPDEPDEPEPFTESMEFQMTAEEAEKVGTVLENASLTKLCSWAIANNVHSQTRVDMRELAGRDPVYEDGEEPIEYPSVDVDEELESRFRDDDPSEVTEA